MKSSQFCHRPVYYYHIILQVKVVLTVQFVSTQRSKRWPTFANSKTQVSSTSRWSVPPSPHCVTALTSGVLWCVWRFSIDSKETRLIYLKMYTRPGHKGHSNSSPSLSRVNWPNLKRTDTSCMSLRSIQYNNYYYCALRVVY